jgi:hypothetical protein
MVKTITFMRSIERLILHRLFIWCRELTHLELRHNKYFLFDIGNSNKSPVINQLKSLVMGLF